MATLRGETRDPITFKKGDAFISISPVEATSVENNRQYSIAYGSDYHATVSFIVDMQGWQFNHSNFERFATTFTQVSLLPLWQDEVKYNVQPALVESIDWLHFILTSTRRDVIVELFATPVLLEDSRQNQFSRFALLVSPEAAIAFGETLRSEITEARERRIAQGFAKGDDGVITDDDDDDEMATQYRIVTTEQEHKQLAPNVLRWFRAAFKGDIDTLNLLLESDIGLESTNAAGLTALHFAAAQGHAALVTRLIESGANIDAKTNTGLTAKNLAAINHNSEVVALFENIP